MLRQFTDFCPNASHRVLLFEFSATTKDRFFLLEDS